MKYSKIFDKNLDINYYIKSGYFQKFSENQLFSYIKKNLNLFELNNCLEIGFGTGSLPNKIYSLYNSKINIEAIDTSPKMYEYARKTNNNINWKLMNSNWLDSYFFDKKYDLLYSNLTLQWIDNFPQKLNKISSNFKRIIFTVPLIESFCNSEYNFNNLMIDFYSKEELSLILAKNFINFDTKYSTCTEKYDSYFAFFKHLKKIGSTHKNNPNFNNISILKQKKPLEIKYYFALIDINFNV